MAAQRMGTEATQQAHPHPPFTQGPRSCFCWRRGSSSPSCSKTPTSEINRDHPCLHQERFHGDINGYGFSPSYWLSHQPLKPSTPCQHSGIYLPRTSIPDGTAACAQEAFPASTWFSPSRFNQEKGQEKKNLTMESPSMKGCGACGAQSNQITLYKWYLVRRIGSSESVEVSVGGFFGTAGIERFETSAIVQRLEKCRLLAQDGVEVRLAGLIDDCTTVSNGFSLNLVQSFLSGFPYTWNHLLDKEFHMSSTNGRDHQILGDSRFGAVADVSQLSFEGCCPDQERKTPSLSQKEVSRDHSETRNDVELNTKPSMTEEVQAETESKSLSIQAVAKDNESSEPGILKDDQLNDSNLTGTIEQGNIDSSNTTMEELQANVPVDQSKCKVKKKPGRGSHLHVSREQGDTVNTQIDAGNTLFPQLNQSPRITRSMYKFGRHAASTENNHNFSDGFDTVPQSDTFSNCKDVVQTPKEDFRPCVESRSGSFSSPLIQESVAEDRQSARRLSKKNNKDKVDGGKALNTSPCHYPEGIETPVEIEVQRTERSLNAKTSLNSGDDPAIMQEEIFVTEALPENVCNAEAENEDLPMFGQKSEVLATVVSKTNPNNSKNLKESNEEGTLSAIFSRQCSKRPIILPPLPCPRVSIAKQLISTAFGLKTSRSGRLLVPPLAHWCGQSLLRDKDGGIIAISDGSKDMNNDGTGSFKFKPPAEERLQKLQKRLCEAAIDRTPSKKKRAIRKKCC